MAGKALTWQAGHRGARAVLGRALAVARDVDHLAVEGESLRYLAIVDGNTDRWDDALEHLAASKAVFENVDDVQGVAMVLSQTATVWFHLGRLSAAREVTEHSLAIFRASGNRYRETAALGNLASIAVRQGHLGTACRRARESLEAGRELEDPEAASTPLATVGEVSLAVGDLDAAVEQLTGAYEATRAAGNDQLGAGIRSQQAVVALERGEIEEAARLVAEAARHAAEAARHAAEAGSGREAAVAALVTGMVQAAAGQPQVAEATFAGAESELTELSLEPLAREATANRAALVADERAVAMVVPLLEHLAVDGLVGTVRPTMMIARVIEVLRDNEDGRVAVAAERARQYVAEKAELIDDDELRASFLGATAQCRLCGLADEVAAGE